jgi:hypothetical protein
MSNVKIKKAKIKDELFLDVEYTEDLAGHSKKDTKLSCTVPIHNDLKDAFAKFPKHLAMLCDEIEIGEDDRIYEVKGFSIGGNDENEGVTLSGSKEGTYGLVNLNSPFQKWEKSDYTRITQLSEEIEAAIYEINEYLFNGKKAPEQQLSMFEDAESFSEETI